MSIIKSFSVGNGDMFYIKHISDNFSIIDCNLEDENEETIVDEIIQQKTGKQIVRETLNKTTLPRQTQYRA